MSSRSRFIDRDDKDITPNISAHRLLTQGGAAGLVVKHKDEWWSVNAVWEGDDTYKIVDWRYKIPAEDLNRPNQ